MGGKEAFSANIAHFAAKRRSSYGWQDAMEGMLEQG